MKKLFFLLLLTLLYSVTHAQNRKISLEDAVLYYKKGLLAKNLNRFNWANHASSYTTMDDENKIMTFHDPFSKTSNTLSAFQVKSGLESFPYLNWINGNEFYFTQEEDVFLYDVKAKSLKKILSYPASLAQNTDYNSKGKRMAFTIENNLFIADEKNNKIAVTQNTDKNIVSGQAIARYEFGISKGTFWSPSGKYLAYYQKDESNVADYPLVNINTTPATLNNIKYPMIGQGSEIPSAWVYSTLSGKSVRLQTKLDDHYITNLGWDNKEKCVYIAEVNRDQNHMRLNKYNAKTGKFVAMLFEEKNDKWVEPEHAPFFTPFQKKKMFWLSERDGYMNIYQYNIRTKKATQLTNNHWVIKKIIGYSPALNSLVYTGTGANPMNTLAFMYNLNTGKQTQITRQEGVHEVSLAGKNNEYLVTKFSSPKTSRSIGVYNLLTGKYQSLFEAPNPLKDVVVGKTEIITLKSYDGSDLYARVIKPSNFDPSKKYPVLVYVYGGPHAQMVVNRWNYGAPYWMQWMAEQGYIIFTIDGHGSGNRGFKFESEIFRNLGEHEMQDQLIGVDWLKRQSYVDANRLAVHGWSYGGFMTTSLMLRKPGVFSTGVAGGPVIDWKWYEVMYGERYMDTEATNPEGFEATSLLNYVKNLKGNLLTIHGMVDDVVVPQHNYSFLKKCVEEGVQTDFFPYPMHKHNVRGEDRVHLMRKVLDYIIEHNK